MNEIVWAKLLLRVVGILLIGLGAPRVLDMAAAIFQMAVFGQGIRFEFASVYIASLLGAVVQTGFGVFVLAGGPFLMGLLLRGIGKQCLRCGYDISAVPSGPCPECGETLTVPQRPAKSSDDQSGSGR